MLTPAVGAAAARCAAEDEMCVGLRQMTLVPWPAGLLLYVFHGSVHSRLGSAPAGLLPTDAVTLPTVTSRADVTAMSQADGAPVTSNPINPPAMQPGDCLRCVASRENGLPLISHVRSFPLASHMNGVSVTSHAESLRPVTSAQQPVAPHVGTILSVTSYKNASSPVMSQEDGLQLTVRVKGDQPQTPCGDMDSFRVTREDTLADSQLLMVGNNAVRSSETSIS